MDYSQLYWISLIVSLGIFWSLDGWLSHFHDTGQNLTHGYNNILLAIINTLLMFVLASWAAGIIYLVEDNQLGLMTALGLPIWAKVVIGFLWVDFIIYATHFLKHRWNWLWRLHLVHHNDTQVDATTVLRQHPGEAAVSFVVLSASTALLGIPSFAVMIFYCVANPITVIQHVNIRIPDAIDRPLSYVLNTPNMHKVHHLVDIDLSNSNYGYVLSFWDRCFGTYISPSKQTQWNFGVAEYSTEESTKVSDLLIAPLETGKTASDSKISESADDSGSQSNV